MNDVENNTQKTSSTKFAKFKIPLHINNDKDLWLLVSLENDKQSGENLLAFINMLDRLQQNNRSIKSVKIIISDYLNRHYRGDEKALQMGLEWKKNNEKIISASKIPTEIIHWRELYEKNDVSQNVVSLNSLRKENQEYQTITEGIASSHSKKGSHEAAINYTVEECAVISSLTGVVCYPADDLNEALKFSVKYFNSNLTYHGYAIYDVAKKKKNKAQSSCTILPKVNTREVNNNNMENTELMIKSTELIEAMERCGVFGVKNQTGFFQQFLALRSQFSSAKDDDYGDSNEQKFATTTTAEVVGYFATKVTT